VYKHTLSKDILPNSVSFIPIKDSNNPLILSTARSEESSTFKNIINISYNYFHSIQICPQETLKNDNYIHVTSTRLFMIYLQTDYYYLSLIGMMSLYKIDWLSRFDTVYWYKLHVLVIICMRFVFWSDLYTHVWLYMFILRWPLYTGLIVHVHSEVTFIHRFDCTCTFWGDLYTQVWLYMYILR
jgi:hypothetical protein